MCNLKIWWREIIILLGFPILYFWGHYVYQILDQYEAKQPAYFWLVSEVLYDTSILLFMYEWKGQEFFQSRLRGKGLFGSIGEIVTLGKGSKPSGRAWRWFRVNRIIAMFQPGCTAVMIYLSAIPFAVRISIFLFLVADMGHTLYIWYRSKSWETGK